MKTHLCKFVSAVLAVLLLVSSLPISSIAQDVQNNEPGQSDVSSATGTEDVKTETAGEELNPEEYCGVEESADITEEENPPAKTLSSTQRTVYESKATGDVLTFEIYNGTARLSKCDTSATGEIIIPSSFAGYKVTQISGSAFLNCKNISKIVIPNTVTAIGNSAFRNCTKLTTITIPSTVTEMGSTVFENTGYYNDKNNWENETLYFGNYLVAVKPTISGECRIKAGTTQISGAFINCVDLSSVVIPDSVTSIGGSTFYGCTGLSSIVIPNSATYIGGMAFYGCTGLTKVTIPNSVTSIGDSAFSGCTGLTGIVIPDSVTSIGSYTFYGCTGLTNITIPDSVTAMEYCAFANCTGLTNIAISNSIKYIQNYAFEGCTGITSIKIPDSVRDIGYRAFRNCTSLLSVTIGSSVVLLGASFEGCNRIAEIINHSNLNIEAGSSQFGDLTGHAIIVHNGEKSVIENVGDFSFITIDEQSYLLGYTGSDDDIQLPLNYANKDYSINKYAFYNCAELKTITIPNSVTSIGNSAFSGCTGLKTIIIPNSVTSIGMYAFSGCTGLSYVSIPDSVSVINLYAFENCTGISYIKIPNSVIYCRYAFKGCVGLKSAGPSCDNYNYNIEFEWKSNIPDYSFDGLAELKSVTIPDSITSIGQYAFNGCTGLESVMIFDSVETIGRYAFNGCTKLKTVYYSGVMAQWNEISIETNNTNLKNAKRYYNSRNLFIDHVDWQGNKVFDTVRKIYSAGAYYSYTLPEKEYFDPDKEVVSGVMPNYDLTVTVTYYENVILASGKIGENISWKMYENGDLVFKGYGEIPNYTSGNAPWYGNADKVRNIRIPSGITGIGDYAFQNCVNAANIEFGHGVLHIGKYAFSGCAALKGVSLPESLLTVSESAFAGCSGLKDVRLPEYLTELGAKAFYGCTALTKVTLGGNVSAIGNQAFDNCTKLTAVTFRGSPLLSAGSRVFGNTGGNTVVYYYSTVSGWDTALINGTHYLGYFAFPINAVQNLKDSYEEQEAEHVNSIENLYYIKVVDKHDTPLDGAVVELGNTTYTTNSYGLAYFERPVGSISLRINCTDHNEYFESNYIASGSQMMDIISLSDRPSTVQGVSCGGKSIATSVRSINCNSKENISIVVAGYSKYTIIKYELLQGNRIINTVNTSAKTCTFTVLSNSFEEGQNVFVKMYTSDGNTVASALNIDVMALANISESKLLDELSSLNLLVDFGDFGKVNLPINFRNDNKAKIYTYVDGRTIRVGINLDVNNLIKNFKSGSNSSLQKYLEKQVNQSLAQKSFGWDDKATGFKYKVSGYIDIEYLGNGQYYVKTSYVKVAVSAKLSFGGEASFYGLVGVYFKATLSADTSLSLKITRYVPESGFNVDNVTLSLENKLELEAGIYILFRFGEASVYGNLRMGFDLQLYPKAEFEHVFIKGEIGARWSLVWGLFSGSHKFVEGTIFEYPAAKAFLRSVYTEALKSAYYEAENYSLLDRGYLETRSDWLAGAKLRSLGLNGNQYYDLQTDTYINIAPKIVTAGNTTVMVWLDDNPERDLNNFQTLYYSVYDSEQNIWSAPRQLDNNNTFDCEFDLISDGEKIYVVYTEQKRVISGAENLDITDAGGISEYVNGIEIAFSVFKNGSFSTPVYITNNNVCEIMPTLSIIAGNPVVSWIVTDNLGLADSGNKDSACFREYGNYGWSQPVVFADNQDGISAISVGSVNGKSYAAYLVKATNDSVSLIITDLSGNAILLDTGRLSEVSFVKICGQDVLMWISDGALCCISDIQGQKVELIKNEDAYVSNYQTVSSGGKTVITFVSGTSSGTDVFAVAVDNEHNVSEIIRITDTEGYIQHYGVVGRAGSLLIAFNETKTLDGGPDTIETTTDLRYMLYTLDNDISLLSLLYDADGINETGEMTFTAEIRNNGMAGISNVSVVLYDQDGKGVVSKQVSADVKSGCTKEVEFTLAMPQQLQSAPYVLEIVSSDGGTDKDMADNRRNVLFTYCDLAVDAEQKIVNDKNQLLILVSNTGNLPASAVLEVFAGGKDGKLIDMINLGKMNAGDVQQCQIELEGLITEADDIITCIVSTESEELFTTNNSDSLKLLRINTTGYSKMEEEAVENPVLDANAANYDKYTDNTVSVEIEVGKEHFEGIKGLVAGSQYVYSNGTVTLQKTYLDTLDGTVTLDFAFNYGENGIITRTFQLSVYDSAPIMLEGAVSVDGSITVGTTVTSNTDDILPADAEMAYIWLLDGETVGNESSFTIPADANGKTLTLKVTGINGFFGEKECAYKVKLQSQAAPKAIVIQTVTDSAIYVAAINGAQYSIDGGAWQDVPVFEMLLPNREYMVHARYAATPYAYASDSVFVTAVTLKSQPARPSAPIVSVWEDTFILLQAVEGYEYNCNGGTWQSSPLFENLSPDTVYMFCQRSAETETAYASAESAPIFIVTKVYYFKISGAITCFGDSDENVTVKLLKGDKLISEYVGNQNYYQFENVKRGKYTIEVSKKGHACRTYTVEGKDENVLVDVLIHLYGDTTGDGAINGKDVVRLNKYLANYDYATESSTVEISTGADADGNGAVNIQDVIHLMSYLAEYDYKTQVSTVVLGA